MESPERVPPQRIAPISQAGSSPRKSDPEPQARKPPLSPCDRLKPIPKAEDHCEYGTERDANSEPTNPNHTAAERDAEPSRTVAEFDRIRVEYDAGSSEHAVAEFDSGASRAVADFDAGASRAVADFDAESSRAVVDFDAESNRAVAEFDAESSRAVAEFDAESSRAVAEFDAESNRSVAEFDAESNRAVAEFDAGSNRSVGEFDVGSSRAVDDFDAESNRAVAEFDAVPANSSVAELDAVPSAKVEQFDAGSNRSTSKRDVDTKSREPGRRVGKRSSARHLNGESLLSVCRICMAPDQVSISIFDNEETLRMCEKVMSCAAIQIDKHDGLPDRICQTCATDLETAFNFKARCEKSDALLREKLGLKVKTIVKTEFVLIDCDEEVNEPSERHPRRSRTKKRIGDDFLEDEDFSVQETDDPSYETPVSKKKKLRRKRKSASTKVKHERAAKKVKVETEEDDDDDVILVPPKKRKSYPCPDCDKTFPYPSVLKVHAVIHTKKKEYKCVLCSEAFVYTKELYAHYKIAHPDETGKPKIDHVPKTFPCSMCDKVFGENKNLKVHEAMHLREKKYTCEGCSLGFTNMTVLNNHKKQEHPELCRPYACNVCNRSFKLQSALERHVDCHKYNDSAAKINDSAKKPPLVKDLFKSIAPLTTTYWSDSFSD